MSEEVRTIDLTPTRDQHARTLAYILGSHMKGTGYSFGHDFWNYSPAEENAIFDTWKRLDAIDEVYKTADLSLYHDTPKKHLQRLIRAIHEDALEVQNGE
jgi:hypothetical protein